MRCGAVQSKAPRRKETRLWETALLREWVNKKKSFAGELAGSQLSIELPLWRGPNRISVRRSHRLYNQHTGSSERTGHNQVYSLLDRPLLCNALLQDVVARLCLILLSSTQLDAFYLSLRKKEEEGKKKRRTRRRRRSNQCKGCGKLSTKASAYSTRGRGWRRRSIDW